ncbi:MAG: hypothetical protein GF398_20985 [Chitinivibrionales bacterium]|nr:hypothetical protein [Chitinivibrionales bacterium]
MPADSNSAKDQSSFSLSNPHQLHHESIAITEEMYRAQKLEAVGELAGGIAHDFNSSLGAIAGYADMIREKFCNENDLLDEYVRNIHRATDHAIGLTDKLLAFSQRGKIQKSVFALHDLLTDVMLLLVHSFDKRIILEQQFSAHIDTICGDFGQLQNTLLNIAFNARDALGGSGEIVIATDNPCAQKIAELVPELSAIPARMIQVSICDNGCGMDEATRHRIFEPFYTTKKRGTGTGLGLAAVFGIIESHHGFIHVESQVNNGTAFSIFLPIVDKQEDDSNETGNLD